MSKSLKTRSGRIIVPPGADEDAEITAAAMADPDAQPLTDAELVLMKPGRGRPVQETKRAMVSMRLEPEVLAKLRASGDGWQTRVANYLKEGVETGRL